MLLRRAITIACAFVLLVVAGCSSTPDEPERTTSVSTATPIVEGIAPTADLLDPVEVTVDEQVPTVRTLIAAAHTATLDDTQTVEVPTRRNTAAFLTALNTEGQVLARATTVRIDGFEPSPLNITYRETAFTRLLATPPFTTSNPLGVMLLRGAAERSPALTRLEDVIRQNAQADPSFDTQPTRAEAEALGDLSQDVLKTLRKIAASTNASTPGNNRVAPQWAQKVLSPTRGCLDVLNDEETYDDVFTPDPLCVQLSDTDDPDDNEFDLEVEHRAYMWDAIYAVEPGSNDPRLAALIPPRVVRIPSVDDIVSALLSATTKLLVSAGIGLLCNGASFLGLDCPEEWVEEFNPAEFFDNILADLSPLRSGEATFTITEAEATSELFTISTGQTPGATGYPNAFSATDINEGTRNVLALMSIYTASIEPLISLILGTSLEDTGVSADGSTSPELFEALLDAVVGLDSSQDLPNTINATMDAIRSGDIIDALPQIAALALKVVSDPEVIRVILGDAPDIVAALTGLVTEFAEALIPGLGWIEKSGDFIATAVGSWQLINQIATTPDKFTFAELTPDLEVIITETNWLDQTYEGFFSASSLGPAPQGSIDGEGTLQFQVTTAETPEPALPGVTSARVLGIDYGTYERRPAALVVIETEPNQEGPVFPNFFGNGYHVHLFTIDNNQQVTLEAAYTDYPLERSVQRISWALESGQVVSYQAGLQGSSGARVPTDRITYAVTPTAITPSGFTLSPERPVATPGPAPWKDGVDTGTP